jgi:hypothetical protein
MIMRRRPLLRAAAIGGGAYVMGKRSGQRQADQQETQAESAPAQGGQAQEPAQGAPAQGGASIPDQLNRLSALHDQGALDDAEFASAKAKLLGT